MSKYKARREVVDEIAFDSKAESEFYLFVKELKENGIIKSIKCHPKYELQPSFISDIRNERPIFYEADFEIEDMLGNIEIVDIKGLPTEAAKLKRKWFMYKYKKQLLWIVKSNKYGTCGWCDYFIVDKFRKKNRRKR